MNVKETAFEQIEALKERLKEEGFEVSGIAEKNYNYEITASEGSEKVKVLVYFGKKGVKTLVQGNSANSLYSKVDALVNNKFEFDFGEEEAEEPPEYIGTDESGKGDFFGPLVISAVYVDEKLRTELKNIGVRDSKALNDHKINHLAEKIKKIVNNLYDIVYISPSKYNQLYKNYRNLNDLLNWGHSQALKNILEKVSCNTVITDKFSNRELDITSDYIHRNVNFTQSEKAEKYIGVAAASILARAEFNRWFNKNLSKGLHLPKGSSNLVTKKAQELSKKYGKEYFENIAKINFKIMNKI
jgi:ribonuclease HIII